MARIKAIAQDRWRSAGGRERFCALAGWRIVAVWVCVLHGLTGLAQTGYQEAPLLADQVKAGKLPPVQQRLPANPRLIQPVEKVGHYGGTWHVGLIGYEQRATIYRHLGYENLVAWDPLWQRIIPNVAQSWTVSPDGREYVFKLRRGMRWSDGMPFTSDDVMAWYEDFFCNTNLTREPQFWLKGVVVKALDAFTVRFSLSEPNSLFLTYMATPEGSGLTRSARHFVRQYLPRYSQVDTNLNAEGIPRWVPTYFQRANQYNYNNPAMPTLNAWIITNAYEPGNRTLVAVRNPYYWKVDAAGHQLPYIDRVEFPVVDTAEELKALALQGKLDCQRSSLDVMEWREEFSQPRVSHLWSLYRTIPEVANAMVLCLNLTHRDPAMRQLLATRTFREALSIGIDRRRIIAQVFAGVGVPWQVAPRPDSELFHRQLATQHTDYDPARAEQLLQDLNLPRQADRFRHLPDGRRIRLVIELSNYAPPDWERTLRIVQENWRHLGVELVLRTQNLDVTMESIARNQHDAAVWWGHGAQGILAQPHYYLPVTGEIANPVRVAYGIPWAYWHIDPRHPLAEIPPPSIQAQIKLYDQIKATTNPSRQTELMRGILDLAAQEFLVMGIVRKEPGFGLVKRGFRNVPQVMPDAWTYPDPGPANPCQFFIDPQSALSETAAHTAPSRAVR